MPRWAVAAVGAIAIAAAVAAAAESHVSQAGSAPDCVNKPLLWPAQCANLKAPASFDVKFITDVGNFTMHVQREWSPYGADRFYSLSRFGYWGGAASGYLHGNDGGFFRVVPGFVVQWGIAGNVPVSAPWANAVIPNDPVVLSNIRGTVSYAAEQDANGMAFNRTTQIYVNFGNNSRLDGMGFTPFAVISDEDMAVVGEWWSPVRARKAWVAGACADAVVVCVPWGAAIAVAA